MKTLLLLLLLLGVSSPAGTELVHSFKQTCPQFFNRDPKNQNRGIPPTVLKGEPGQYQQICQLYDGQHRFASLYDTVRRTPVYSASTLYRREGTGKDDWKIEPQLDELPTNNNREMRRETDGDLFVNQALTRDYSNAVERCDGEEYTRGHLFPRSWAADVTQAQSTFTLTNAAPQQADSNGKWGKQVEEKIRAQIEEVCGPTADRPAYVVTGVVPGGTWLRITRGRENIPEGINIPKFYWVAFSCRDNSNRVHSAASIAHQTICTPKGSSVQVDKFNNRWKTVEALNQELSLHYKEAFEVFPEK